MIYSILLTDKSTHWNAAVVSTNENVRSKSLGIQYFKGSSWKNIIDRINRAYEENSISSPSSEIAHKKVKKALFCNIKCKALFARVSTELRPPKVKISEETLNFIQSVMLKKATQATILSMLNRA